MRNGIRKIAAWLLAFAMLFTYMPLTGATAVYADDAELPALEVQVDEEGLLTWSACESEELDHYEVYVKSPQDEGGGSEYVEADTTSFDLNAWIDHAIREGSLSKSEDGTYEITVSAYDANEDLLTEETIAYAYDSPAAPVEVGSISGLTWDPDTKILTWDPYEDPNGLEVEMYQYTIVCGHVEEYDESPRSFRRGVGRN